MYNGIWKKKMVKRLKLWKAGILSIKESLTMHNV